MIFPVLISTPQAFVIFSPLCPAEEGSDGAAMGKMISSSASPTHRPATMVSVILVCEVLSNAHRGFPLFLLLPLLPLILPFRSPAVPCECYSHCCRSDGGAQAVSLTVGSALQKCLFLLTAEGDYLAVLHWVAGFYTDKFWTANSHMESAL